ncbi:MAG TPA: hypothetical protein VEF37_06275 [Thermodesulfovibrionales bacterium]|nr:hypothetical protein [Thermodesulfovibrionales bacterium]
MLSTLVTIFVGWTGIISSLVISLVGLIMKKHGLLLIGALLAVPFSWYIGMTPLFKYWGLGIPVFQIWSAVAIKRKAFWLSWLLILPYTSLVVWIAISVLIKHQ